MTQGGLAAFLEAADVAPATGHGLDECIALVAHELRNPLGPLKNVAAILKRSAPDDAAIQSAAGIIDRQVSAMTLLIDDLLDASGLRAGKIELRRAQVPISAVLESALETAQPVILQRGHTLHVSMPPEPVVLEADMRRLSQVLHNLIANAAKYTNPGGRICIDVRRDGSDVVVTVSDTGIGIAPAELDTVFELFRQAGQGKREHSQGGIGIGLYLARTLIEAHGGTLRAVSQGAGRGSAFVLRIPGKRSSTPCLAKDALVAQLLAWEDGAHAHESGEVGTPGMGYVRNRTDGAASIG